MNKIKQFIILASTLPVFTFAQSQKTSIQSNTIKGIANDITSILSGILMPTLFSVALALFVWGIVDFIRNAENSEERKRGKQRMLWGILGLFAMITFIGLTSVLTKSVFNASPLLPQLFTNK